MHALLAQTERPWEVGALFAQGDSFRTSPDPFIALMIGGFVVGAFGYLAGSKILVGVGVTMIFFATLLIPLAFSISH